MRMRMQMQLSQHVAVGRSYFVAIGCCHCHCHWHCSCMGTTASTTFFQLNYPASRDVCGIWKSQESQAAKSCRRYWIATRGRGRRKRNLNIESFRQLRVALNSWILNLSPTVQFHCICWLSHVSFTSPHYLPATNTRQSHMQTAPCTNK